MKLHRKTLTLVLLALLVSALIPPVLEAHAQQSTTYEIPLFEAWNLIGLPCMPEDTRIEVVLADTLDNVESVWTYDEETGYWSSYSPGAPSDLTEIRDGKGYWIKVWTDVLWEIDIG